MVNGVPSEAALFISGVPQGSILGPLLFIMYTSPLGDLLPKEITLYSTYADDNQLYLLFEVRASCMSQLTTWNTHSTNTVQRWMNNNMLKLNTNKTEFIIISDKRCFAQLQDTPLTVGAEVITASPCAWNVGVKLDATLSMIPHISSSCSSANYHLRNIGKTRKFLTRDTTPCFGLTTSNSRLREHAKLPS